MTDLQLELPPPTRAAPVSAFRGDPSRVDGQDYARRLATLTPREREVHALVVVGLTSKGIGRALNCSFRTVEVHRTRIMRKMEAPSIAALVRMVSGSA